jgi:hypothetical protein
MPPRRRNKRNKGRGRPAIFKKRDPPYTTTLAASVVYAGTVATSNAT